MANIKTRESEKGTIKTIDRMSVMAQHMKQSDFKIKEPSFADKKETDSPDSYAQSKMSEYGNTAVNSVSIGIQDISKDISKQIHMKKDSLEIKKRKDTLLRARHTNAASNKTDSSLHSAKIKTPSEAQKKSAVYKKAITNKSKRDMAAKASARIKSRTNKAKKNAARSAHTANRFIRRIIAEARAMTLAFGAAGSATIIIVIICVLFGAAFYFFGDESSSYTPVSAEVEAYTPVIQKYANEYGMSQYTELIKAVMMQESGGKGSDPMQASECRYNTKYPKKPNGIKDPEYSISCGIRYLKDNLDAANVKSPVDMDRIKLALQGYNFGSGYIPWALKKYGGYSYAGAAEFAKQQAGKNGWSSYGDTDYVDHVLRYYPYGNYSYDVIYTGTGKLGLPIKGMTSANISSHFGPRSSPGGIGSSNHQGLDIAFPTGTKILACESGTVISAGWIGGYGKCVIIDHGKNLQTVYGHMSKINVSAGQKVVRGQVLGEVGSTGNSTGPHLHLGVKFNGSFVNPENGWISMPR